MACIVRHGKRRMESRRKAECPWPPRKTMWPIAPAHKTNAGPRSRCCQRSVTAKDNVVYTVWRAKRAETTGNPGKRGPHNHSACQTREGPRENWIAGGRDRRQHGRLVGRCGQARRRTRSTLVAGQADMVCIDQRARRAERARFLAVRLDRTACALCQNGPKSV